jgi:hypothetical protein
MAKKKTATKSLEITIDEGATKVEEIHKSIAELPLKILEESDVLRKQAREVRRTQERAIGAIYDLVRKINHEVGSYASDVLAETSARKTVRRTPRPKKRSRMAAAHAH